MSLIHQVASQVARAQASLPPDGPVTDRFVENMAKAVVESARARRAAEEAKQVPLGEIIHNTIAQMRAMIDGIAKTKQTAATRTVHYYESRGFFRK